MSARALQLREGIAPTRDRLTTTVFMAALVHGVIIVGVTFGSAATPHAGAPGLEVLIVSNDVPEARSNDHATYLAPRTSLIEMPEVPVLAEGTSDHDRLGLDDAEDQKIRGPQRDELWVTPDTR